MKKLFSLIVALMMLFSFTAAFAEEPEMEEFTIEVTFDGTMVSFEDGFQVGIPNEWVELEMEGGVAYGTEDGMVGMTITYNPQELTFEQIGQVLVDLYGDVNLVSLNGIQWATFVDEENDTLAAAAVGLSGYYIFTFSPASDEALNDLATQIMATIQNT